MVFYRVLELAADVVFAARALAMAQLEPLNVGVELVGQDGLEAAAVVVGERQLRAGVRALTTHDHPRRRRP